MRTFAAYIAIDGLSFSYPNTHVLSDISLTIANGDIAGLIGENGAGKSTLLSLIAGVMEPDQGRIYLPERTGFIAQETDLPFEQPVQSLIDAAVAPVRAVDASITDLSTKLGDASLSTEVQAQVATDFDAALGAAEELGLWELDARIETIVAGLGLAEVDRSTPIGELSGGQRRRFALAALLLEPHDALIFDEPTNHLDDTAVDFLISEISRFKGPVLIASHDRFFLDSVCTELIDLDPALGPEGGSGEEVKQAVSFGGGFSEYIKERETRRTRWAQLYTAQETEREKLEETTGTTESDIFHSSVSKSEAKITAKFYADRAAKTQGNRVRSAKNRLKELERYEIPAPPKPLEFQGIPEASGNGHGETLEVRAIAVENRLQPLTFHIDPGDHILVEGPNGVGKSTLLSVLEGVLEPTEGELLVPEGLKVARLKQDDQWTEKQLNTPVDELFAALSKGPVGLNLVEMGLLRETSQSSPLRALSLGQRRRVSLGLILASPPDLLLLDEPTNHLSLALSEELESAIEKFPGRVILASHDRWIRKRWTGKKISLSR
ncbi:ABC-F family ATP-binding cassette domain-containing protein [Corynebacterium glutamicum]|uniref:ABC-F family ATP-binding cassette domain-containing protein n=1 Tax=Corynebacterium glutamicum TaxID=1718 RepID=UPI00058A5D9B|nr:ABC-F family ATP-binding cassette domain-containing protein [Corynebacterium glutamicum]AJE67814.1 ABC transporter ATPase [Corynebacterium glutamicum]OKX93618.1 ABC transporter ATP-binding protein [Corynebacterium glutamicum]TWS37534.1 ABC transporter ATPase [Corynebacterium glutamicum]